MVETGRLVGGAFLASNGLICLSRGCILGIYLAILKEIKEIIRYNRNEYLKLSNGKMYFDNKNFIDLASQAFVDGNAFNKQEVAK